MTKFSEATRLFIIARDFERCTQCGETDKWKLEIHHIIANTKLNRKLYGSKIQDRENGILCCHKCHEKHSLWDGELRKQLKEKWKEEVNSKMKRLELCKA